MRIPLVDLQAQYAAIKGDIEAAIRSVLENGVFVGGSHVDDFETEFASFCSAACAVAVGNGTDALALSLRASGVGPGDEVITVPNSFIATAEAIGMVGAKPVFVDIEPTTFTMSPRALNERITPRTRAVVPVHLYGQMADMDPILRAARERGLRVLEDACQAHGADYHSRRAGSMGDAAAFSFYPGKNLGAYGDGGAVVTGDPAIADRIRMLRNHGRRAKYDHGMEGFNSRLDALQAAVLSVKLRRLERWNQARREVAAFYDDQLAGIDEVALPREAAGRRHVYHLYVIRAARRDALLEHLRAAGVQAGVHYPIPLHLLDAYKHLGLGRGAFPSAEQASREVLSLPIYPELTPDQARRVCGVIKGFYARAAA